MEPIEGSETSAYNNQTPGKHPKEYIIRFSVPTQTSPEAQLPSCTMGNGCFLGINWLGYGADHPPHSTTKAANGLELYLRLPTVPALAC